MKKGFIPTICCAILLVAVAASAQAQNRTPGERVYIHDLEGIWMHDAYIEALKKTRMPHKVAKKVKPMVIAVRREGRAYPFLATDFEKAALMFVLDVEPDLKPGSYRLVLAKKNEPTSSTEAEFLWFKGQRDADRKFRELDFKDPFIMEGKWATYKHVGMELGPVVNGIVLAGRYKDQDGQEWLFTETGQASFPDKSFYFELSINDKTAGCEYFEGEDMASEDGKSYYGYAWKAGKLQLFRAKISKERVRCEAKPFVELTPL
jgi:hypothetical protein